MSQIEYNADDELFQLELERDQFAIIFENYLLDSCLNIQTIEETQKTKNLSNSQQIKQKLRKIMKKKNNQRKNKFISENSKISQKQSKQEKQEQTNYYLNDQDFIQEGEWQQEKQCQEWEVLDKKEQATIPHQQFKELPNQAIIVLNNNINEKKSIVTELCVKSEMDISNLSLSLSSLR